LFCIIKYFCALPKANNGNGLFATGQTMWWVQYIQKVTAAAASFMMGGEG